MNNVVSLTPPRPYPFPTESKLYFPVRERAAFFDDRYGRKNPIDEHKVIVRDIGGIEQPIGFVGKNYKVLHTEELCKTIEGTFIETMPQEMLDGVQVVDQTAYHGGMCLRQYIFPKVNADIESKHSQIAFRTIVVNGYDGSSSFKLYSGAIDRFCTNGMVSGSYDMIVKRHTQGLTIPRLDNLVKRSIDIFYTQADQWRHWVKKVISDEDAKSVFEAMPNVSERRVEQLLRQFRIECQSHGRTVWALYSAATFYATSNDGEFKVRETANDHAAMTVLNREQQVRSWLNTPEFEKIAA